MRAKTRASIWYYESSLLLGTLQHHLLLHLQPFRPILFVPKLQLCLQIRFRRTRSGRCRRLDQIQYHHYHNPTSTISREPKHT